MSFSLKREIEFYINDTDSTDGVTKLAILPEFELKLEANLIQVYRKIIGEDPEMLPRSAVDQISPISLGFITYLKPSFLDGKMGVTAPEKLLYDSLGGALGYRGPEYYKAQFGRVNRLIPLYIFLKTTTAIYKVNLAYIDSLEISFDINYLLTGKWTAQAISLDIYDSKDITFTNVKDYTSITNLIRNKYTVTTITDYDNDAKEYKFPITKSNIKIINSLMPVFDKNIKVVTGYPKDLIVTGRVVSGELSAYLSSRIDHSKDFLINLDNDTTKINRKFKVSYVCSDGDNTVEIILPYAQLNLPTLEFDDVLNTTIQFTSSESDYGLNNDISLKYYASTGTFVSYSDFVDYVLKPEYYYKFNETQNTTLYNYGSKGSTFDITRTGTAPTINLQGPYLNSKAWNFNSTVCQNTTLKQAVDEVFISFWYKPNTVNANEYLFAFQSDQWDMNHRLTIDRSTSVSGGGYRGISFYVGYTSYKVDLTTTGTWNNFVIFFKNSSRKLIVYINNVKKLDLTFPSLPSIAGDYLAIGPTGGNGTYNSLFSEVIISQNVSEDKVQDLANIIYNITDINVPVSDVTLSYTHYNDSLLTYKGYSDYYYNVIKSYGAKAFWRFNDNDSTKVRDHISGAYPLTISNNPELGLDGPLLNDKTSKSIWFSRKGDGTLQYTTSSSPISMSGITKNTYTFWVYIDGDIPSGDYKQCLIKTGSNTQTIFTLLHRNYAFGKYYKNNKWYYYYGVGYNDGYYNCAYEFNVNFPIPEKTWTFVALACNRTNNTIKIYVDGIYINTISSGNVNSWWPSTIALEVGKRTYVDSYRSTFKLSEFAYFENELSDTTIQGIYAASGITGFSYTITPSSTSNTISIRKYIPSISRGLFTYPNKNSLNISGNNTNVRHLQNVDISSGNLYTVLNSLKVPIIKAIYGIVPQKSSVNISGSEPIIKGIKILYSIISGDVRVNKKTVNVLKIYNVINKNNIYIYGKVPSVIANTRIIYPDVGEINLEKYIPVCKIITKVIKPTVSHIIIGNPNRSSYQSELLSYPTALYYRFVETSGTTLYDYSGNSRNATLYNTPTLNQVGPHSGKCIYFNKASLQHAIYNSAITMPSAGTIMFWTKVSSQAAYDHLFQFNYAYNGGNNVNYFKMTRETTSTYWIMPFASGWSSAWQMSISDNTWTHVAITWNTATNQISTYKNGSVITNNGSHTSWPTSLQPLGICRGNRDGTSWYHTAYMSDFSLTNQRLSDAQVSSIYSKSTQNIVFDNVPSISIYARAVEEVIPTIVVFI
jgi:hypothetical protein